jgi:hypothetical protein
VTFGKSLYFLVLRSAMTNQTLSMCILYIQRRSTALVLTHLRHFRWLPDEAGTLYHKSIPIKILKKKQIKFLYFIKGQGTPWEVIGHKGAPGGGRVRRPSKNA